MNKYSFVLWRRDERGRESPRVRPGGVIKLCVFVQRGYANERWRKHKNGKETNSGRK